MIIRFENKQVTSAKNIRFCVCVRVYGHVPAYLCVSLLVHGVWSQSDGHEKGFIIVVSMRILFKVLP